MYAALDERTIATWCALAIADAWGEEWVEIVNKIHNVNCTEEKSLTTVRDHLRPIIRPKKPPQERGIATDAQLEANMKRMAGF